MTKEQGKTFSQRASAFFHNEISGSSLEKLNCFFCRPDGVLIYSWNSWKKKNSEMQKENLSIGALIGGLWQAAETLASFIPGEKKDLDFRLSFDTSEKGIYVLPVNVGNSEFYLGIIYDTQLNPGLMKTQVRRLKDRLEEHFSSEVLVSASEKSKKNGDYLFENITDAEIDRLFSFSNG